jgi:hypothetical protein
MSQLAERRRAHRRLTEAELIFFHRGIPLAARLLDLSESGARLSTAEFLRLRTPLVVVLSARGRQSLTLTARVRFAREGSGTGIEFTRLTPQQRRRLSEIMQALAFTGLA